MGNECPLHKVLVKDIEDAHTSRSNIWAELRNKVPYKIFIPAIVVVLGIVGILYATQENLEDEASELGKAATELKVFTKAMKETIDKHIETVDKHIEKDEQRTRKLEEELNKIYTEIRRANGN